METRTEDEIAKFPALRADLKVSRQVLSERVTYVVKDPIKNQYYRFDESEWSIISLFDGKSTVQEMVDKSGQMGEINILPVI